MSTVGAKVKAYSGSQKPWVGQNTRQSV